jgi:CubicO group peptidase (beta-lactamase class C family)
MWRWERALYGGKVLDAESLRKMTTPFKDNYGFGLFISSVDGHKKIDHGGGIEGFNTEVAYYPDDQLAVIVLANLNGGASEEIANKAAVIEFGGKVTLSSERKEITLKPQELSALVGTYSLAPGVDLTVTQQGSQLWTQLTGQGKIQIYPESPTSFFLKVVDAQLTFAKDSAGKATEVTLHQNGRDMLAKRK